MPGLYQGNINGQTNGVRTNESFHNSCECRNGNKATYLVTGASRGIGKGLVASFLQRPNSIVIACVRDIASSQKALHDLAKAADSQLLVMKLDCESVTDAAEMAQELQQVHQIAYLDVVVANAAIAKNYGPCSTMQLEHLQNHMMINTYSMLLLFQALRPLMEQAKHDVPKFCFIGAPISTITRMEDCARAPLGAYGVSKLAANYFVRKFHFENKGLISFAIDPGHVQTDMGAQGARLMGRREAPTTLEASVEGICARIDEATKEKTSGQFVLFEDGSKVPW